MASPSPGQPQQDVATSAAATTSGSVTSSTPVPGRTAVTPTSTPTPTPTRVDPSWLLPDLQVLEPETLFIQYGSAGEPEIRFSTTVTNTGPGHLEMIGAHDHAANKTRAIQRIQTTSGAVYEREAGLFVFHEDHDHWHFEDFTVFELWTYTDDGDLDQLLATTGKLSFCIVDSYPLSEDAGPPLLTECDPELQAIASGWADVYAWEIPGQRLDLAGIPDGRYALRTLVDPDDRILEVDETNNTSVVYVERTGLSLEVLDGP